MEGFRTTGLSMCNNIDPDTLLRELIQNGLDAFLQKKEPSAAHIHFQIEKIETQSIPALEDYKAHFDGACKTQRALNFAEQAEGITKAIQDTLDADMSSVLWIMDNGIGLDPKNMRSLLSDGASMKADVKSTGSYGNGHMTAFPASDLRYLVYGGVFEQEDGKSRIVAGQTILATHELGKKNYAKDGFLVEENNIESDLKNPFKFYGDGDIPKIINEKLDWIEKEYGTGSVVGILGFNRFNRCNDDEAVMMQIERVAANHFAPAIYEGRMRIHVKVPSRQESTVHRDRLGEILGEYKDRLRRNNRSIGPSGRQAWDAWNTLADSKREDVETSFGSVTVAFRPYTSEPMKRGGGGTQLQLYRNGMWITGKIHRNKPADFGRSVPFNALILLDPDNAEEACNLVREAEGPRHIDLEPARLGNKRRAKFDKLFRELHEAILKLAPQLEVHETDPKFFSIEVLGKGHEKNKKSAKGSVGQPERLSRLKPQVHGVGGGVNPNPDPDPTPNPLKRYGNHLKAQQTAVWENGGMNIRLKPLEENRNVELRLVHASGADTTCDSPPLDQFLEISVDATLNGKRVPKVHEDANGRYVSIDLGKLDLGKEVNVQVPCRHPGHGSVQVELIKRATIKQEASE